MKILSLQAENIKRLVAVEIEPDGALVQITGRNGAGKTSVLDSIWWALSGAKNIQVSPIRAGARTARIRLDLGELIVTRKFRLQDDETFTTTITVENADGARFGSPQTVLEKLVGALSFDPLEFTRKDPKGQLETLKGFVPTIDWSAIEAANDADYKKRTDLNRRATELKARAGAIRVPDGTPAEPVDANDLIARLDAAGTHNASIERQKGLREAEAAGIADVRFTIERETSELARLREATAALEKRIKERESAAAERASALAALPPLPEPVDTAEVRRKLSEAQTTNQAVALAAEKTALDADALALEVQSGQLTKAMRDRADEVAKAIAAADLPVQGLGFGDGCVTLDGLPFSQASDAAQLRTSVALAMAMNPKLRILRIRDGSLLDEDGLRMVAEMAEARDFQVWLERVDTSGKVGIVIEDGSVRGARMPEAAE